MSECKGCGSTIINCGAPIWEDLCSNKDCTYDSDHFRIQMNAAFAEVKRQQRLQDAAPELYEALVRMKIWCEEEVGAELPCDSVNKALRKALGCSE